MKVIQFKEPDDKMETSMSKALSESDYDIIEQKKMLNKYYLDMPFSLSKQLDKAINVKLCGYKQQDKNNLIYGPNHFINKQQLVQKLVESKLQCFYCNTNLALFYRKMKQDNQWTLDRIDNYMGHNYNNVLISCLKCNLQRGNINKDKFLFTKEMVIHKQDDDM